MEQSPARRAEVGGLQVRRALPQRHRRTVGAWCFVDHFGPTDPADRYRMTVGPHPHIGLSTVTWLLDGEAVHTDSLGSEQPIRPGQLNLMTAGNGIAHAEETPRGSEGRLHGVQFWVAQPDATRFGPPGFEHHAELPVVDHGPLVATVLVGELLGERSPARFDTPMVGADVVLGRGRIEVPLREDFEHALVPLDGPVRVHGAGSGRGDPVEPDTLVHLGRGSTSVVLEAADPVRVLLLGGEPFEAPVLMWWNFLARTRDEVDAAIEDWNLDSDRFGPVSSALERIVAPAPPWHSG